MSAHIRTPIGGVLLTRTDAGTVLIGEGDEIVELTDAQAVELMRCLPTIIERLNVPVKEYDHDPRPGDDPESGDRCKDCGDDITWVGPSQYDWMHVDSVLNR